MRGCGWQVRVRALNKGTGWPICDGNATRPWWENRWLIAALIVASAVPLLYPPIPPLVDLLGHMGRYRVELDLGHSPWLPLYYGYHWAAIGNLGVDLLVMALGS